MLLPLMAAINSDISAEEAMVRLIATVELGQLPSDICTFIIGFYESVGKENRERHRDEEVISNLLRYFKVHPSNLNFTTFGVQSLNQAVGECLFMSKQRGVEYDQLY